MTMYVNYNDDNDENSAGGVNCELKLCIFQGEISTTCSSRIFKALTLQRPHYLIQCVYLWY